MNAPPAPARVCAGHFDRLYERSEDPWGYRTSAYEREKYAVTLDATGPGRHRRALEVGCSIGVLTELLAPRCRHLTAIDYSTRAIRIAQRRLSGLDGVQVRRDWLARRLAGGAMVVAVSWRGAGVVEPLRGDDVHELLDARLCHWHVQEVIQPAYRLDRFGGHDS